MKKFKTVLIISCCLLLSLTGCSSKSADTSGKKSEKISEYSNADYPHYNSVQEILKASDVVVEGKIIEISYETIDISIQGNKKGISDTGEKQEPNLKKHTVYTIEVINNYKGSTEKIIKLQHMGNNSDKTSPVKTEDDIELAKGKSYLFILYKVENNGNYQLLNVDQCIYPDDEKGHSDFSKQEIVDGCK